MMTAKPDTDTLYHLAITGTSSADKNALQTEFAEQSLEAQILLTLGMQQIQQQAGYAVGQIDAPLPIPTATETYRVCSDTARRYFQMMTQYNIHPEALPEFLKLVTDVGWVFPPEYLPGLDLKTPRLQVSDAPVLTKFLTDRATWLINRKHKTPEQPASPQPAARFDFQTLRTRNPALARNYLREHWQIWDKKLLSYCLKHMTIHLSMDDEALLKDIYWQTDQQHVQAQIIALFAQLPESQFMQQLRDFADEITTFDTERRRIMLIPPDMEILQNHPLISGIYHKQYTYYSVKMRHGTTHFYTFVSRLLSYLPPGYFMQRWSLTSLQFMSALKSSVYIEILRTAYIQTIQRTQDAEMALRFLRHYPEYLSRDNATTLFQVILEQEFIDTETLYETLEKIGENSHKHLKFLMERWAEACQKIQQSQISCNFLLLCIKHKHRLSPTMVDHLSEKHMQALALELLQQWAANHEGLFRKILEKSRTNWSERFWQDLLVVLPIMIQISMRQTDSIFWRFRGLLAIIAYRVPLHMQHSFIKALIAISLEKWLPGSRKRRDIQQTLIDYIDIFRFRRRMHQALTGEDG